MIIILSCQFLVMADNYKLHIDDQLYVSVYGHSDLEGKVVVGPDGTISLPLIGDVKVVGQTVNEITTKITNKYSEYIKDPSVNITLEKYQRLAVMVMGEVNNPGTYQLKQGQRVLEAISRAGGFTENADMSMVKLSRKNTELKIDLEKLINKSKNQKNHLLKDGDVIYIPKASIEVTILGEVRQSGRYQLQKDAKLSDLIARAGGLTSQADRKATYSTKDQVKTIDLSSLFKGDLKQDPVLKDSDSVYIPKTSYKVTILGEVKKPGSYVWYEGMRLADLMAQAGSQTKQADLAQIKITHQKKTTAVNSEHINFKKYLNNNQKQANPLLKAGDIVIVKETENTLKVSVMGQVNKPGSYSWEKDLHLADLMAQAGNQTERGDITNIQISHPDGKETVVNLKKYLTQGQKKANPVLKPGDTVYIKEKSAIDWQQVFFFVSGFKAIKDLLE